jgi:multiple sugar transport system permease protein
MKIMIMQKTTFNKVQKKHRPDNLTERLMITPSIVALAAISIFPLLYMIYISFFDYSMSVNNPTFVGINNWVRILKSTTFWESWGRTVYIAGIGIIVQMIFGIGIALLIYNIPKGQNIILTFSMMPLFVAPIVSGLLGRFLLNSTYGLYSWILRFFGYTGELFASTTGSVIGIIAVDVWEWMPLITMIVFSGLQSMDIEVQEAATIDGANYIQKLRHVILPLVSPVIMVALLIRMMDILRYVDTIKIITEGGPANATKTSGYHLMEVAFRFQNFGQAAVLGIIMIVLIIMLSKLFIKIMGKGEI